MIIYIAELSHTGKGRSPNVVPLAAGYLAVFAKKHFPHLNITIFRDPDLLLQAIASKRPDIVGFSVHLWSERLSNYCAMRVKEISKNITVVAGGPSVDDIDPEQLTFLKLNPYIDVCISNEGELAFLRLIEHVATYGKIMKDIIIDGCSTLASDGSLLRGSYVAPELSQIPSPYLEGLLDSFLSESYEPIIQSMRGCPYACKFCVSGTPLWSKIRTFEAERIFAEIDYIKKRTKSDYLILTDENFGITNERDVAIAEYIIKSYRDGGYPRKIYYYSAKIISDYVLRIVEILSPIGEFGISFQTLDEKVAKEIKRTNISYEKFLKYVNWAAQRKIRTSTEMIFGFPGERVDSYVAGIEQLMRSGVDRIYSYNLRLFRGIDLATQGNRDKYDFKTSYRLPERTYGRYGGEFVTETEEVVVGSKSFNYADYQKIRKYGLFLELSTGRGYLTELIKIMVKLGLPGEKLIAFLAEYNYDNFNKLFFIVSEYEEMTQKELYETPELCIAKAYEIFSSGAPLLEVKLNLIYTGRIILDREVRKEFLEVIKEFIGEHCRSQKQIDFFDEYLDKILMNQIVSFDTNEKPSITVQVKIRLDEIEQNSYNSVDDLSGENFLSIEFDYHEDTINFLKNKILTSDNNEATLQDIYMSVARNGLLRQRRTKL
jgi:radical SAM superfamily enzyme YgiQ (UPF0313 family)